MNRYKVPTIKDKTGIRARMLSIREERRERQGDFAVALNEAATALGVDVRYSQDMVSKMENGLRTILIEDVGVIAAVDPKRRGKLWLGWGETEDATTAPVLPPVAKGFRTKAQVDAARRRPGRSA